MYNFKLETAKDVRNALGVLSNDVLNGKLEESKYRAFVYGSAQLISSIRTDDLEAKLNEIEELINNK